jgi:hypothetical protein
MARLALSGQPLLVVLVVHRFQQQQTMYFLQTYLLVLARFPVVTLVQSQLTAQGLRGRLLVRLQSL